MAYTICKGALRIASCDEELQDTYGQHLEQQTNETA